MQVGRLLPTLDAHLFQFTGLDQFGQQRPDDRHLLPEVVGDVGCGADAVALCPEQ